MVLFPKACFLHYLFFRIYSSYFLVSATTTPPEAIQSLPQQKVQQEQNKFLLPFFQKDDAHLLLRNSTIL